MSYIAKALSEQHAEGFLIGSGMFSLYLHFLYMCLFNEHLLLHIFNYAQRYIPSLIYRPSIL